MKGHIHINLSILSKELMGPLEGCEWRVSVGAAEKLNEFLELISKGEQLKVTYCKEDRETQWFSMWEERQGTLFKSFMYVTQADSWEMKTIKIDKSPILD